MAAADTGAQPLGVTPTATSGRSALRDALTALLRSNKAAAHVSRAEYVAALRGVATAIARVNAKKSAGVDAPRLDAAAATAVTKGVYAAWLQRCGVAHAPRTHHQILHACGAAAGASLVTICTALPPHAPRAAELQRFRFLLAIVEGAAHGAEAVTVAALKPAVLELGTSARLLCGGDDLATPAAVNDVAAPLLSACVFTPTLFSTMLEVLAKPDADASVSMLAFMLSSLASASAAPAPSAFAAASELHNALLWRATMHAARKAACTPQGRAAAPSISSAWASHSAALLETVVRVAIVGSGKISVGKGDGIAVAGVIAATASTSDVDKTFAAPLAKALKSRLDSVLPHAPVLIDALPALPTAWKAMEDTLLPALLPLTYSAKDETRADAARAVAAVTRATGSAPAGTAKAIGVLMTALLDVLTKKKASVPTWQNRHGILSAVSAAGATVLATPGLREAVGMGRAAADVVSTLLTLKETHEGTKVLTYGVMGVWLSVYAADAASPASLPADVMTAFVAGLKASTPFSAASDGIAEALWSALAGDVTPDHKLALQLSASKELITALADLLQRGGCTALASGGKKSIGTPINLTFALAAAYRLACVSTTMSDALTALKLTATEPAATATPTGAKASATAAAKKPAAAGAAKVSAAVMPPVPALAAKTYSGWEFFTASALANATVFSPMLVGSANRPVAEVAALAPALSALVDALRTALCHTSESVKMFPKTYMAFVMSDLKVGATLAEGAEQGAEPKWKAPNAQAGGIVALLSHPLHSVRAAAAAAVTAATALPSNMQLASMLMHALYERVNRVGEVILTPALSASCPQACWTGVGDGPVAANALTAGMLSNAGKLPAEVSGQVTRASIDGVLATGMPAASAGSDKPAAAGAGAASTAAAVAPVGGITATYAAVPAANCWRAALTSVASAAPAGSEVEALVPVALLLCAHPAVAGVPDDVTARCTSLTGAPADPRTAVSRSVWKRVYTSLTRAAGYAVGAKRATAMQFDGDAVVDFDLTHAATQHTHGPVAASADGRALLATPSSLSVLLQRKAVAASMVAHLLHARAGLFSASHVARTVCARAAALLMRGVDWMLPRSVARQQDGACGAGGRFIVTELLLPAAVARLVEANEVWPRFTEAELAIWQTREGVVCTAGNHDESVWDSGYAALEKARALRATRVERRLDAAAATVGEATWLDDIRAEMEERRAAHESDSAVAAAAAALRGKSGKGALSLAAFDEPRSGGFSGGAASASSGKGAKGGKGAGGKDADPNAAKLAEQANVRARVQGVYESMTGALHLLLALLRAAPAACQPLLPHILPALLPAAGSTLCAEYALLVVAAALRAATVCTILETRWAGSVLHGDWLSALRIVQDVTQHAEALATGLVHAELHSTADANGAVGQDLSKHIPLFKRIFAQLMPRLDMRAVNSMGVTAASFGGFMSESASVAAPLEVGGPKGLLPPVTFHMLFPILRAVITASPPLPFMAQALSIIAAHTSLPNDVRARVSEAYLHGGEALRALTPKPATMSFGLAGAYAVHLQLASSLADGSATDAVEGAPRVPTPPPIALDVSGAMSVNVVGVAAASRVVASFASMLVPCVARDAPALTASGEQAPTPIAAAEAAAAGEVDHSDHALMAAVQEAVAARDAAAASARDALFGVSTADAHHFHLRLLRPSLESTLLHALRVAPRTQPAPDAVLAGAIRGMHASEGQHVTSAANGASGAAGDEDDDEDGEVAMATVSLGTPASTATLSEIAPLLSFAGLLSPVPHVRSACLSALELVLRVHVSPIGLTVGGHMPPQLATLVTLLTARLWMSTFDVDADNAAHAAALWRQFRFALVGATYAAQLITLLSHPEEPIRSAASKAMAAAVRKFSTTADATIKMLFATHAQYNEAFARPIAGSWKTRAGVLTCLAAIAERRAIPTTTLPTILPFLIQFCVADEQAVVREAALNAGRAVVDAYGASHVRLLLPVLEAFLASSDKSPLAAPTEAARDAQRKGCVVLLGACAKYLPAADAKFKSILSVLIDTLNTPSESVQRSVSQCLPPLAAIAPDQCAALLQPLLTRLTGEANMVAQRGAAFGLAGILKGLGIRVFHPHNIMPTLEAAAQDTKNEYARAGAMFGVECICESMGMLFEPYVTRILPLLLKLFGDASPDVREAAQYAAKMAMSILTGYGVKLVVPAVLNILSETAWRSKQAAIQVLGNMAFCAPKQLGQCLPQIVPKLCAAFDDPHPKVQAAGREALQEIGKVIKNPEIAALAPKLLAALVDPSEHTKSALTALAEANYCHAIDPASLALIIPIIRRGLADRVTSIKVCAALIVGNLCSLIADARDFMPYLPTLITALKKTAVDPIPDVRAVTSRAFGSLLKGVGEDAMAGVLPWLISSMLSETSTVERSGAAQSIADYVTAAGEPRLSEVLNGLLVINPAAKQGAREGVLWLVVFLPSCLGHAFSAHIRAALPLILQGLSDDVEAVREVALRAGNVIVKQHARTDATLLLPTLENGLSAGSWRIRLASIQLLGELLSQLSGARHYVPTVVAGNTLDDAAFGNTVGAPSGDDEDSFTSDDDEDEDALLEETEESESESDESVASAGAEDASPATGKKKVVYGGKKKLAGAAAGGKEKKVGGGGGSKGGAADEEGRSRKRADRRAAVAALGGRASGKKSAAALDAAGASEKGTLDESFSSAAMDAAQQAVVRAIGMENRNRVLAALYMARCDGSNVVRQSGVKIWKDVVLNTPRTLREILPALMSLIISALAADNPERRIVSGRCLGEVVRKLGDRVLPEIVPILRKGLTSDNGTTRCGVCLGLAEVIEAATKRQIEIHLPVLINAVRDALCDPEPDVRRAAARAYDMLHTSIGTRAVTEILPSLLAVVENTGDEEASHRAMAGLQAVISVRGKEVLPSLLPKLLRTPITPSHAGALAAVAAATSSVLHYHVGTILPPLIQALAGEEAGASTEPAAIQARLAGEVGTAAAAVVKSVESSGVAWTLGEVLKYLAPVHPSTLTENSPQRRRVAAWLIGQFVSGTSADYTSHIPLLIKELLLRFMDSEAMVLTAVWEAMCALVAAIAADSLADYLDLTRSVINSLVSEARYRKGGIGDAALAIPGFCIPKGLDAVLPIYLRALLNGNSEERETAATALRELVEVTPHDSLKPFYIKITGPLIRVVADKFPWQVKTAILRTLIALIDMGGVALKPFQPQLQTTFTKGLTDATAAVRIASASALGKLMPLAMRVDPLINELIAGIESSEESIAESMLVALNLVALRVGEKITPPVRARALEVCEAIIMSATEEEAAALYRCAGAAVAALSRHADADTVAATLSKMCVTAAVPNAARLDARAACVDAFLKYAPSVAVPFLSSHIVPHINFCFRLEASMPRLHAVKAIGYLLSCTSPVSDELGAEVVAAYAAVMPPMAALLLAGINDADVELRLRSILAVKRFARYSPRAAASQAATLAPVLVAFITKEGGNMVLRGAAERALLYLTNVNGDGTLFNTVLASVNAETQRFLSEYARRVLVRMDMDSDEEEEDADL